MATENAQVIYDVGNSLHKSMTSAGLMAKAISDLELLHSTQWTDDCRFGRPYPDNDVTVDRPKLAGSAIDAIKIVLDRETGEKKEDRPPFLTDNNPAQTLENVRRMLDLLSYLNRSEPMNDYAEAGVCMILWEVGETLTELGDTYNFVKKESGGAK